MTPKEKANLLYNKMVVDFGIDHWQIKQCALVAVDEILSNNCGSHTDEMNATNSEIYCDEYFWEEVKQEIEKL